MEAEKEKKKQIFARPSSRLNKENNFLLFISICYTRTIKQV